MANWNPFAGLLSAADPNVQNEAYGVPESDVRMAQAGLLGNLGATLLAAGQRISPAQRAQLLGQLGPQMGQFSTDIYNAAQRRYQQGVLAEAKRKQAFAEEQARTEAQLAKAEADKRAAALQKAQEMAISMGTPTQIRQAPDGEWATQAAPTKEELALQLAQAGGTSAIPGIVQSLLKEPTETADKYTLKQLADGTLARVNLTTGVATPIIEPSGKPLTAAAELSPSQINAMIPIQQAIDAGQNSLLGLANALKINDQASYGPKAALAGWAANLNMASEPQKKALELERIISTNVLSSLRAVFGGNPTGEERRALAEIEAGISQPPDVRKKSIQAAMELAQERIRQNQRLMESVKTGFKKEE
jgi:hypothetical protein